MVDSASKQAAATGNVVEGFSKRFNILLDRAGFPRQTRMTAGAKRFDVVPNTFKSWITADRIPGTHALLLEIVETLLKEIGGRHNAKAVVAWLLAGDAVPNPLGDETDALAVVELYLQITKISKRAGVDFELLPRKVQNLILTRVRAALPSSAKSGADGLQLDNATRSMLIGMLETARTMT